MEQLIVERTIWIAAPSERVWRAITEPQQLKQWYATGCPWEIPALQVGATVKFYNTDTDVQLATIEVVAPPHQFTVRWQLNQPDPELVNTTMLEEENGGTRVTVTQAGYESLPDEIRQKRVSEDAGAYAAVMESLKAHLERE